MAIPKEEMDLRGRAGHLDDTQQRAFDEFKQQAEQSFEKSRSSGQRKWFDDPTLL